MFFVVYWRLPTHVKTSIQIALVIFIKNLHLKCFLINTQNIVFFFFRVLVSIQVELGEVELTPVVGFVPKLAVDVVLTLIVEVVFEPVDVEFEWIVVIESLADNTLDWYFEISSSSDDEESYFILVVGFRWKK